MTCVPNDQITKNFKEAGAESVCPQNSLYRALNRA